MVRHRTRWLLVKVEVVNDIHDSRQPPTTAGVSKLVSRKGPPNTRRKDGSPSRKDFAALLRTTISLHFGIAAEGASSDLHIRFFDDTSTQLALVRVSRQSCDIVRAALTLLLTQKQLEALGASDDSPTVKSDVIASVISVHGSARTAKLATFRQIRGLYRHKMQVLRQSLRDIESTKHLKAQENKLCLELQERLSMVQEID